MIEKERKSRDQAEIVCIEMLVPKDHLLRKIDAAVDFNKIYDFVEDLYCPDNGRPSIDPVVLFNLSRKSCFKLCNNQQSRIQGI